jgi:putative addiction module component (TIGR02574 family)
MEIDLTNEDEVFELTETQKRELDRRLELARNNPSQGRTWEEIKAEFMRSRETKVVQ